MGSLKKFNLKEIVKTYRTTYLFETGTWKGDSIVYALHFSFKRLFSSEIMEEIATTARLRFKNNANVEIITKNSIDALSDKAKDIDGNCLFWLDAHFPGAEEGLKGYNDNEDELKFPLQYELEIIKNRYPAYEDVIIIDDMRIYEDGPYQSGNMPSAILRPKARNLDFLDHLYADSHTIIKSYKDEGYIILLPKSVNFDTSKVFTKKNIVYYLKRIVDRY